MQTRKPELRGRATEILDVLFNNTLHRGHWSNNVQFGTKKNFFQWKNGTLSLVLLTKMQQLQQFFLDEEKKIRIGTGFISENILVQPVINWNIQHHWQTSTSPVFQQQTFWHKLPRLNNSSHLKKSRESVPHWKNGCYVFYNQTKSFNWRNFRITIRRQHSIGVE